MIRRARPGDADRVLKLLAALGRPEIAADRRPQRDVFIAHLDDEACEIYLAVDEGGVAGVASLWFRRRLNWMTHEAWVPDLFVSPAYRRRGHARALLDACVAAARDRGCHRVVLESGHQRADAHRLYESYGFDHYARSYELQLG